MREVLAAEADIFRRWKEHSKELLNTLTTGTDPPDLEPLDTETNLIMEEVLQAIASLKNGNSPGVNEILAETLKAIGTDG